jgi:hypothetical protein
MWRIALPRTMARWVKLDYASKPNVRQRNRKKHEPNRNFEMQLNETESSIAPYPSLQSNYIANQGLQHYVRSPGSRCHTWWSGLSIPEVSCRHYLFCAKSIAALSRRRILSRRDSQSADIILALAC